MKKTYLSIAFLLISISFYGQDILSKEKAVTLTLENNYDIRIIKNNLETAKNNKGIYNSGYLPTITANAGTNYSNNDTDSEFQNGNVNPVNGAESKAYNASVGLNYTIFNGFNRKYTFKRLKENYNLTELQVRQVMENTLTTLFLAYYEVGRLTENEATQKATLEISKKRLQRAEYSFEYGQNTKLAVLNAEVDVNNDSITYIAVKRELANSKRDLNIVLGRKVNTPVKVNTDVTYAIDLKLNTLLEKAKNNNAILLQANKNIKLGELDVKIRQSGWMPNVSLTSSYAWTKSNNDAVNDFSPISNTRKGINAGLNMSWNIFDGGKTKTNVTNAKIALETQGIKKLQQEELLERNVNNTWEIYQNALFSLQVQEKNVVTTQLNFKRTNERYKLGQVTSIDFRQAQVNLINASLSVSNAKYTAKNAELQLLKLAGILLENNNF
ncbi:TolC family protein [Tenacibaculum pacificus]|uniref:TolC family protein n=1 Tax=Tenacibaculum pacificus TaxID=3018314 RepID=UPI0022F3C500|nr:TolC family protein [Tenacibaculum pacificus]WBX72779.1 TolC family protein [Tenacibaculum pacificus]